MRPVRRRPLTSLRSASLMSVILRKRQPVRRRAAESGRSRLSWITGSTGVRRAARLVLVLPLTAMFLLAPAVPAAAVPNPFDICSDPPAPQPEVAGTGLDALIRPPGENPAAQGADNATLYERYGMAGQRWHTTELGCSDMLAKVGNQGANLVFDIAKAIDRTTISLYQAAYSQSLLDDLAGQVSVVVQNLRDALYLPYLTPFVLVGVMWAAWHGLVRRRATMTIEGTVWMIIAVTCALWFLNRPAQLMDAGNTIVTSMSNASVAAVGQATAGSGSTCVSPPDGEGGGALDVRERDATVRQAANTLWSTLVCRPWLAGEFGTGQASSELVEDNGYLLLNAQAFGVYEADRLPANSDQLNSGPVQQKQAQYQQVRDTIKEQYGSVYPLFQGKQWGTRLGIAMAALLAAVFAGLLVLVVAIALIVLKVAFLMLMMVGPLFLLAGIHPGAGRLIALRWFELLLSTLAKQVVVAVVLALLLMGYSIILAPDSPLPWGIQILLVALLGLVAFIYRKPFRHLFASVGVAGAYTRDRAVPTGDPRTAPDGDPVPGGTRRGPAGVSRRRRLGEALSGAGTSFAARHGQYSDGARRRLRARADPAYGGPADAVEAAAPDGDGDQAGGPADGRDGGGLSWASPTGSTAPRGTGRPGSARPGSARPGRRPGGSGSSKGGSGTSTPRRDAPSLSPPGRRAEAAPPLPFWLRPGGRDDGGGR